MSSANISAAELVAEIQLFCREHANPQIVAKYSRYFKEGYDAYGLTSGLLTDKVKELIQLHNLDLPTVLEAAPALIGSPKYEETGFAILLTASLKKAWNKQTFEATANWFSVGMVNWAHADVFCSELLSPFLLTGFITFDDLALWRFSSHKFQRRASAVALIPWVKKHREATEILLFIETLMTDNQREVHQGVGWLLRETWKVDPIPVETFLLKWKNTAPRLIFQYATEKMTIEQKSRFKKKANGKNIVN